MGKILHEEQHQETKFEKTKYEALQVNSGKFWSIYGKQNHMIHKLRLLPTTFKVTIHKILISVLAIPNKKFFVTIMGSQTTSRGNVHAHKDMQHGNWKINNLQIAWKKFKHCKRINLKLKWSRGKCTCFWYGIHEGV
jgi:hypothetical protein